MDSNDSASNSACTYELDKCAWLAGDCKESVTGPPVLLSMYPNEPEL